MLVSGQAQSWYLTAPGKLAPVPNFDLIKTSIPNGCARECYLAVHEAIAQLGRAMQLGQQRALIQHLDGLLNSDTLEAIALASEEDGEICAAFSVYLTTLEQAYHWPRADALSTPTALHNHKLVIQMLYHAELRDIMNRDVSFTGSSIADVPSSVSTARTALRVANTMIRTAENARKQGIPLPRETQDKVNLLYRTCSQDWFVQGDYNDHYSHKEFGRLHDVVRTNGTQRSVQRIFENTGLPCLVNMPCLLNNLPSTEQTIISSLERLQLAVTLTREELYNMVVDEVVWGQTFAKYSKPVGFSSIGSGGADCPMFRMLDALCGRADDSTPDVLLSELDMRSRHFPANIRSLICAVAEAPSIRAYVSSGKASNELVHSFNALQQLLWSLYEMHRKKAMRIVLSIRAGQLFTSSGTQTAASPEWHVSNSLKSAMIVRFGTAPETREIPAYGLSTPLIVGSDGITETACIRLVFASPLVVGAGDAIEITVQVKPGVSQTRTYSITRIFTNTQSETSQDFQTAASVEVCCRNSGEVSSYLCSRRGQFPAQVTLQPNPHFRLTGNSNLGDHTVFIAQGGAIGVFLSWMLRQRSVVGNYLVVVGVCNLNMLAYADQLYELVNTYKTSLRVVIALSQVCDDDAMFLRAMNIEVYSGRVTGYLESCQLPVARATFVCGSSRFGLDVARCLEISPKGTDLARLSPVTTSRLPKLRLHVASGRGSIDLPKLPVITRAELAMHNSPGDAWISIGKTVYDISTLFNFHPGGEKTLICRAGLDADDMFNSVHEGSFEVVSLLNQMAIGTLDTTPDERQKWDEYLNRIVEIQNDLTNTSRFEQRPTGSPVQLSSAPPVELIRSSLSQLVKGWNKLLETSAAPVAWSDNLQSILGRVLQIWDRKQLILYKKHFNDDRCCALGLRDIFNSYQAVVEKVHNALDCFKKQVLASISDIQRDEARLFELATLEILESLSSIL